MQVISVDKANKPDFQVHNFVINAKLPSLNDYVAACRANKYKGASFKKDVEEVICWAIRQAQAKGTLKPINKPCELVIEYYQKDRRIDVDNKQSANKYILDAMQKAGIIPRDSQKYIRQVYSKIYDSDKDAVRVIICELNSVKLIF